MYTFPLAYIALLCHQSHAEPQAPRQLLPPDVLSDNCINAQSIMLYIYIGVDHHETRTPTIQIPRFNAQYSTRRLVDQHQVIKYQQRRIFYLTAITRLL